MNNCIEISCYVFLKAYIKNLYETLPAFKIVIVIWPLLLILQYGDKYKESQAFFFVI